MASLRAGAAFAALASALAVLALLAIWAGVPAPAAAADAEADSSEAVAGDSTAAGADSIAAGDDQEEGEDTSVGPQTGRKRRGGRGLKQASGAAGKFWEAHPTYSLKINKQMDVTNYGTKIGLTKILSDKVTLNVNADLTTRENTTLNRSDASNAASAGLLYVLNDNISFGGNYVTNLSAFSYDLKGGAPADKKKNEDLTVSADLTKNLLGAIDVAVKTVAGSTANSFAGVSNQGRRQDLSASVTFAPSERFRSSATYSGKRLFLDSTVDSGGGVAFSSEDLTSSENIALTMSYEVLPGVSLAVDASEGESERQHPDLEQKLQEIEKKTSKGAGVSASFKNLARVTWDLGVNLSEATSEYAIRSRSNRKTTGADLTGAAKIVAWRGADIALGGAREVSRDEYVTADTGDNLHKSLSFKLAQNLGPKATANLSAISDLIRVAYDDKAANPKDRDRLSNRVQVDLAYNPLANVSTNLGAEYSDEQAIYVKGESSANNRTTTRYRVTGRYNVKTVRNITVGQTYDIGAVYSLYEFEENNDALVRNSNISTSFRVPVSPGILVDVDHTYRYQDQGSYREDSTGGHYGRAAGNRSNQLTLASSFSVYKLRMNLRQSYFGQSNWDYRNGKKVFKARSWFVEISGRASLKLQFKQRTSFSLSLERNLKEGSSVNDASRGFWNIDLEASHVF